MSAFLVLAACVVVKGQLPGDRWTLVRLHDAFGTSFDSEMAFVGDATDTLALSVLVVVLSAWLVRQARLRDAAYFISSVAFVLIVNPALKQLIGRSRPDLRYPRVPLSSLSFPSGHAAGTAAFVGAWLFVAGGSRPTRFAVVLGAAVVGIVGFSRLVLAVHYPSDIVAGWLWASAWVSFVASLCAQHRRAPGVLT